MGIHGSGMVWHLILTWQGDRSDGVLYTHTYTGNPYFAWHYISCRVYFSICMAPWPKKNPRGTGSDIQVSVNTVLCKVDALYFSPDRYLWFNFNLSQPHTIFSQIFTLSEVIKDRGSKLDAPEIWANAAASASTAPFSSISLWADGRKKSTAA